MADIHGSPASAAQNPQAMSAGTAPVPYAGPRPSEPPGYAVTLDLGDAASEVMSGIPPMPGLSESPAAHDIAAGTADAPYYPGMISPVDAMGDADPGAGVGNTAPTGGFYDPVREYGGAQGAPGYEGEAQ